MLTRLICKSSPLIVILAALAAVSQAANKPHSNSALEWDQDVRTAWKSALQANRPLLLFVTMDGCLYCQKMKQTTLLDRQVVRDLQTQFVPVAVNVKDQPELIKLLLVKSFPTTVIIETNGDVMESISGYQTPKQLRDRLRSTLRQVANERRATWSR